MVIVLWQASMDKAILRGYYFPTDHNLNKSKDVANADYSQCFAALLIQCEKFKHQL